MVAVKTRFESFSMALLRSAFVRKVESGMLVDMSRNCDSNRLQPHATILTTILNS